MKQIILKIDERVFAKMLAESRVRSLLSIFSKVTATEKLIDAIVAKIDQGKSSVEICIPGKSIR